MSVTGTRRLQLLLINLLYVLYNPGAGSTSPTLIALTVQSLRVLCADPGEVCGICLARRSARRWTWGYITNRCTRHSSTTAIRWSKTCDGGSSGRG